jgi:hypothetical protein
MTSILRAFADRFFIRVIRAVLFSFNPTSLHPYFHIFLRIFLGIILILTEIVSSFYLDFFYKLLICSPVFIYKLE